ncbi:unnamed protein product, partial [marine sediment metagenome]
DINIEYSNSFSVSSCAPEKKFNGMQLLTEKNIIIDIIKIILNKI